MDAVSCSLNAKRWAVLLALSLLACCLCMPLSAQSSSYNYIDINFSPPQPTTSMLIKVEASTDRCITLYSERRSDVPKTRIVINGSNIDIYKAGHIAFSPYCRFRPDKTYLNLPKLPVGNYNVSIYLLDSGSSYQRSTRVITKILTVNEEETAYKEISKAPTTNIWSLIIIAFFIAFLAAKDNVRYSSN